MGVIVILILASICVAGIFLMAFLWAMKNGQYDDAEGPAVRILFDDGSIENPPPDKKKNGEKKIK